MKASTHDGCETCGGKISDDCARCGAPQCCESCCRQGEAYAIERLKPATHGGKRPNAGRKPGTPRKSLTVRLSEPAMAKLHELRKTTGTSAGKLIEGMILNHTKP